MSSSARTRIGEFLSVLAQSARHFQDGRRLVRYRFQLVRNPEEPPGAFGNRGRHAFHHDLAQEFGDFALDVVEDVLAVGDMVLEFRVGLTVCRPSERCFMPSRKVPSSPPTMTKIDNVSFMPNIIQILC